MIVRETLTNHGRIEVLFDFYNDADDTIRWLEAGGHTEIAERLKIAYKKWGERSLKEFQAKFGKQ